MLGLRGLREGVVVAVRRRCWVRCRTELRGEKEGRPLLFSINTKLIELETGLMLSQVRELGSNKCGESGYIYKSSGLWRAKTSVFLIPAVCRFRFRPKMQI